MVHRRRLPKHGLQGPVTYDNSLAKRLNGTYQEYIRLSVKK